jgi:hypothetical protein
VSREEVEEGQAGFAGLRQEQQTQRADRRAPGAGRKHTLRTVREKGFVLLLSLKRYPTSEVAGGCVRWPARGPVGGPPSSYGIEVYASVW